MQIALDKRQQHIDRTDDPMGAGMAEADQEDGSLVLPFQTRQAFDSCDQESFLVRSKADRIQPSARSCGISVAIRPRNWKSLPARRNRLREPAQTAHRHLMSILLRRAL